MMEHNKKEHSEVVMPCRNFQNKECRFQDESRWFTHVAETNGTINGVSKPLDEEDNMETDSVFQQDVENLKPPSPINQKIKKNSEKI